ncbi:tape measure domain-containing protein [Histophilus somni]|uniref:Tape measure domain-containing protein n=1 Tax=Histophilus somni TaxID=731 RepID=A0AAX2S5E5_HISSO|nr:tape measure protein [Histophilus somni]TEW31389.1 tape measure domain-containing protein [Histophilus somni]THA97437.1 tape measure domain-containing protein [Histophilus somni]
MATNSTSFYINLAGNVSAQAQKFGQSISTMASRSQRALSGLKSAVASTSNAIDSIGNKAFIGMTAGGALAGRSMIKTAAEFEMAGIRMKQTFKERGDEANAFLQRFAQDTPMAFGDVQDAMMRLQTAGIDPMNGSLQALVDYNAKVGGSTENLNGYISAISKGFIKGKLSMEEINPLLERNVKVFEILAAETGGKHTAEEMQKMLQEGKLGREAIKALLRGMGKDAAGSAKEQMKTWDGLVSNLGDTFTAMQARFMQKGTFDELKKELGSLLDWLNQKMDSGEFDEFAQQVSDTLVSALRDLKETAANVKPVLEQIGSVMGWLSEKAGGYGNLAKFAAALYGANKIARSGMGQTVGGAAWGAGKWVAGKVFGKKGGAGGSVAGALGSVAGVTPVFVTNFADFAGVGGGKGKKRGKRGAKHRPQSQKRHKKHNKNTAKPMANEVKKAPPVKPTAATSPAKAVATEAKSVTQSIKQTANTALKTTATAAKTVTNTVSKGLRGVPGLGAGLALAEGASVLMDNEASVEEKSESIGSIAGATAGAIVGQALIPIPVVGAMVGSFLGDKLGGWLGSVVGEKLASPPEAQETKLNGAIEVKIKPTEGLIASVGNTSLNTSGGHNSLQLQTSTGYMGAGRFGGA